MADPCRIPLTDARGNGANVISSKLRKAGGFKGVSWSKAAGKSQASICGGEIKSNGKRRQLYLGCFTDPADAARAYDAKAIEVFPRAAQRCSTSRRKRGFRSPNRTECSISRATKP